VVIPAVPAPQDGSVRKPIDLTLKPGWSFDEKRRRFVSAKGETFSPFADLPKGSRIVYKTPHLARVPPSTLSPPERSLLRYMQVILPAAEPTGRYVASVRAWPPVEHAEAGPDVSLPRPQ
jgi:hypothetical protein